MFNNNSNRFRNTLESLRALRGLSGDDVLGYMNLERRRSTLERILPSLGSFGAGFIMGAGAGMLFAPRSGAELRHRITQRASDVAGGVRERYQTFRSNGESREETGRQEQHAQVG